MIKLIPWYNVLSYNDVKRLYGHLDGLCFKRTPDGLVELFNKSEVVIK